MFVSAHVFRAGQQHYGLIFALAKLAKLANLKHIVIS